MPDDQTAKQAVRERYWQLLEDQRASPPGRAWGRIPDFYGSDAAAARLDELPQWRNANVVKTNPDRAQRPVRAKALRDGKLVYMAVPRMAEQRPFYRLDPTDLDDRGLALDDLVTSDRVSHHAPTIGPDEMDPVDFVVCGSTAADRHGIRVGKGAGYSDIEVALLATFDLIRDDTTIATTVHDLQISNEPLPRSAHDFTVDYVVTPTDVISCGRSARPAGLMWESLDPHQIEAIPILATIDPSAR